MRQVQGGGGTKKHKASMGDTCECRGMKAAGAVVGLYALCPLSPSPYSHFILIFYYFLKIFLDIFICM